MFLLLIINENKLFAWMNKFKNYLRKKKKIEWDGFKNNFVFEDEILGYLFFLFCFDFTV
jgi:hypothetical protein